MLIFTTKIFIFEWFFHEAYLIITRIVIELFYTLKIRFIIAIRDYISVQGL